MKNAYFLPLILLFSCGSGTDDQTQEDIVNESIDTLVDIEIDSLPEIETPTEINLSDYDNVAFGFGDLDGDTVIILDKPEGLDVKNTLAFSSEGKLDIVHLKGQAASEDDNGRQNAYNIKNLEGDLFQVKGLKAPQFEGLLFAPKEFIYERKHLAKSTPYDSRELSAKQKKQIESDKKRSILKSEHIASYAEGSLFFAEFEKQKDSVLVSVVWLDADGNTYLDFPAEYNEMSTWRVDDGGIFDFEYYKIITVFESDQGIEIITDWVGFEGSSVTYYVAKDGIFEPIKNAYFYSAPL